MSDQTNQTSEESPPPKPVPVTDRVADCMERCRQTNGHHDCQQNDKSDNDTKQWLIKRAFSFVCLIITLLLSAALYGYVVQERELEEGLLGPVTKTVTVIVDFIFTPPSQ